MEEWYINLFFIKREKTVVLLEKLKSGCKTTNSLHYFVIKTQKKKEK